MPTYCYTAEDDGETVERVFVMGKAPGKITLPGGRSAFRDYRAEQSGPHSSPGTWPQHSTAAGVMPSQIAEAQAASVKAGVPTQFTADGEAIFTSRKHRRDYLKSVGMHDRDAGYSDPTPD